MEYSVEMLIPLFENTISDPQLLKKLNISDKDLEYDEPYAFFSIKEQGISLVFSEKGFRKRATSIKKKGEMVFGSIHLYDDGVEGFKQYQGKLPGGVFFGDAMEIVKQKLGVPILTGGGGYSKLLAREIPLYFVYCFSTYYVNLQFSRNSQLNMITIMSCRTAEEILKK